jgi:hypothetical protein
MKPLPAKPTHWPHVTALAAARDAVKDRLRREGVIVSQVRPVELSEMAKELFEADRERWLAEAEAAIARRQRRP